MEELTKKMDRLDVDSELFEVRIKGKSEHFKKTKDGTFRYNQKLKMWKPVCSAAEERECINYTTNGKYCKKHQKYAELKQKKTLDSSPRYFSIQICGTPEQFVEHEGKRYRYSQKRDDWISVCDFIDNENDKCLNYVTYDDFCLRHKNGIDNKKKDSTATGDKTEAYVGNLLAMSDEFTNVEIIGRENSELDITFTVKDETKRRGIQIKTISKNKYDSYTISGINKYNHSTVIVGVNKERTVFCVFRRGDFPDRKTIHFRNGNTPSDIRAHVFYGLDDNSLNYTFMEMLVEFSKISTFYEDSNISDENKKERDSANRLKDICDQNDIGFEFENTSNSSIDCIINSRTVQCKYSARFNNGCYNFQIFRIVNNIRVPYEDDGKIDFFVFETEKEEFYVIPINVLVYFGYVKRDGINGKISINLHPSTYGGEHWTKRFINRFDLFFENDEFDVTLIIDMSNITMKFSYQCYLHGIDSIRDVSLLTTTNCTVGDKTVKCSQSTKIAGNNYMFTLTKSKVPINADRDDKVPDFFVFYIMSDGLEYYYIFPVKVLIEQKIVGTLKDRGVTDFGLPIPGASSIRPNKMWTQQYVNDFSILSQ